MLVQIHDNAKHKRQVVLHAEINHILNGGNLQLVCILIFCPVHCIVQIQQILFVPEYQSEQAVLMFPLYRFSGSLEAVALPAL